jgi:hypothetical protein
LSGPHDSSRRLWAAAFIGLLGLVLALALALPSARVPLREPFVSKPTRGTAATIPLEARESRKRTHVHRLTLSVVEPSVLRDHEELQLMFSSVPARSGLVHAELRARGAPCLLEAESGGELVDGEPVAFRRSGACSGLLGGAELDLTVELAGEGTLALLGFVPLAGSAPGPIQVPARAAAGPYDVRGAVVDYTVPAPRIELLNHMWRIRPDTAWLWLSLAAGVALAVAGCLIFPTRPLGSGTRPTARLLATSAGAAALLAGSLGVLYAVLVPPLMGPDEPYHLLGFAELASNRALAEDTVVWMGETHLWRIRYEPTERFRTIDVGRPYVVEDDQLRATEVAMRSAVLARVWEAVAPLLRGEPAPRVLLTLRLLNVLVFAAAVGVATALAIATVSEPFPQWLTLAFLFVPSLPFFAMHVSETALLCSVYVLLATAVAVLFLDGLHAHFAGLPLGLGTGLMLAGGRSPWPVAALVAGVLLGRVVLGSRASNERRAAVVFWAGFAAGASVLFLIQDAAYRNMTRAWGEQYTGGIPSWLRVGAEWLLEHPAAAIVLAPAAVGLEIAFAKPRAGVQAALTTSGPRLVRRSAFALAGLVLLSLVGSLVTSYPQLESGRVLTAPERVTAVLATMATMFRLRQPNFLLSTSFWVGFGWLDTSPAAWFQGALVLVVACALVLLLRQIALGAEARRLLWLLVLGAGGAVALVFYTLTTQVSKPLHGRYLIGWYLCLLAVAGSALTLDHRAPVGAVAGPPSGGGRAAFLLATIGLVHAYCLCFILRRYF